jgi:hypothetical protein
MAFLPIIKTTYNCNKENLSSFLRPIKDDLTFKNTGYYSIFCKCGKVYIGQIGHSVEAQKSSTTETASHIFMTVKS